MIVDDCCMFSNCLFGCLVHGHCNGHLRALPGGSVSTSEVQRSLTLEEMQKSSSIYEVRLNSDVSIYIQYSI